MKIAVIGAGSVGMSIATLLSIKNDVTVLDIDENKVKLINNKLSSVYDDLIEKYLKEESLNIKATTEYSKAIPNCDYIIICLPTNYNEELKSLDTRIVEETISRIKNICDDKSTIVIKSTVPVGFTSKMRNKYNLDNIIYNPDFSREGRALYDNLCPSRMVISNESKKSKEFAILLQKPCLKDVPVKYMSSSEAEAVKLFSNAYLALRISYFNELDTFLEEHNLNSKSVIEAVSLDPRIGSYYNNPSFGYGGPCLSKDVKHLIESYKSIPNSLISSINSSNENRTTYIANKIKNSNAKVVGIYRTNMKSNVHDIRESAMLKVLDKLKDSDLDIIIYEPLLKKSINGFKIIDDLEEFKGKSDIIIANRPDEDLKDVKGKVYTRDIFLRD